MHVVGVSRRRREAGHHRSLLAVGAVADHTFGAAAFRWSSISSASSGVQSSTMRSESSNLRKSELSTSSRVYFAGMKLPTVMPKRMTRKCEQRPSQHLDLALRGSTRRRAAKRALRGRSPAGGHVSRSRWPGSGREASGVFSTMRVMASNAARNSRRAPSARRHHERQHQPARGRDPRSGRTGRTDRDALRAGLARPRSRRASLRRRPRPCRRPRTSRSRYSPTARSARREHRVLARGCRRPAPCRSASARSRSSLTQVAVSASAWRASRRGVWPAPRSLRRRRRTRRGSRGLVHCIGHRDDHRGAGHVHRLVAIFSAMALVDCTTSATPTIQSPGSGRKHASGQHLGEVAKERQAFVEVAGRGGCVHCADVSRSGHARLPASC